VSCSPKRPYKDGKKAVHENSRLSIALSIVILDLFGGSGGVGRCTREILRQLEHDRISSTLCGRSHVIDSFTSAQPQTAFVQFANLEQPKLSLRSLNLKLAARSGPDSPKLANTLLHQSRKAATVAADPFNIPILVNYPQLIAPPSNPEIFGVFIHDLNWRLYPGNFPNPEQTDRNCRGWVERATRVVTNSECTRDEILQHYNCNPEKVIAAPLAPFRGNPTQKTDSTKYLAGLGLVANQFYLYPGVWGLHKGHETLITALESTQNADPVVVTCGHPLDGLTGTPSALAAKRRSLANRWENLVAKRKLVVVRGITDLEMQTLREGCRAYVLPSEYEGFGFPLVEAIYHHRPALVSDIQAHQEILGRYPQYQMAIKFKATSGESFAAELSRVPEAGPAPVGWQSDIEATWSWHHTVQRILTALRSTGPS
jgi:hypothetical protein